MLSGGAAWGDDGYGVVRLGGSGGGSGGASSSAAAQSSGQQGGGGGNEGGSDSGGGSGGGDGGGGVEVALVKPCSRCTVPLVDQATGAVAKDKQPIAAMQTFRSGAALGWGARFGRGATFFGANGVPRGSGAVRVGDAVEVLRRCDWAAAA